LYGDGADDSLGHSITMNDDGTRFAVSSISKSGTNDGSGYVKVFQYNGSTWTQLGATLLGTNLPGTDNVNDYYGQSISMSSDGSRLAIGAPNYDVGNNNGLVRIWEWNGTSWTQLGTDIIGTTDYEALGYSVSMSSDGSRVAIGAKGKTTTTQTGQTQVWEWNGTSWTQLGNGIDGEATNDQSGYSVSLSSDGSRLAIGAPNNNGEGGTYVGHVRVWDWDGTSWNKIGQDIDGYIDREFSGKILSMSGDGRLIAINEELTNSVRVWELDESEVWNNIKTFTFDYVNGSVSFSGDGSRLAIGNYAYGGNTSGQLFVYEYQNGDWISLNTTYTIYIQGDVGVFLGYSVALSRDGSRVAFGAIRGERTTNLSDRNEGYAEVWQLPIIDTDGDGLADNVDPYPTNPDGDGDGLTDNVDPYPTNPDGDGDGLTDNVDPYPTNPDGDGDGLTDGADPYPTNPDGDGDGVGDSADAFPTDPSETQDTDGDGVGDSADVFPTDPSETQDTDGDGVGDSADAFPTNPSETQDTDGDGVGDSADVFPTDPSETQDTDGDGVGDSADAFPTNPSETQDTDGDGIGDSADAFPTNPSESKDTDGDGIGDSADAFPYDKDDDGVDDINDAFPDDPSESKDTDGDGVGDSADVFPTDASESKDTDGDGVGDSADAFPTDASESKDTDGDGVGDSADAFPYDKDNDGVPDTQDEFPNDPNETIDADGDGLGDNLADPSPGDFDNDGVPDGEDAFPTDASESKDSDGDGIGDSADAFPNDATESKDSDADGIGDSADAFPNDATESKDSDGDGIGDNADAFPNDPTESQDTDGDGVGDNAQKLQEESKAVFDAAAALDVNDASFNIDEVMTNVITTISAELIATQPIVKIAEEQKTVMKKLIEKEYNVISLPKTEILVDVASFKGTDAPVKTIINVPTDFIDTVSNKLVNPITTVTKIVDEDLNFDGYSINILKNTNGTDISLIITNTGLGERTLNIEPTGAQYEYILTDSDNDTIKYQMNITIGSLLVTLKNFSTPEEYYAFIKSAAYQTKKTRSTTYNSNAQAKSMTQIRRGGVTLSQQEMNKTGKHTFGASSVVLKRKLAAIGKAKLYP
jgi:hypothetical protein